MPIPRHCAAFTDGSGGFYTSDARLRRCGWGWAIVETEFGTPLTSLCGRVPGDMQIVPVAELLAAIEVLEFTQDITDSLVVYSDCSYVVQCFLIF